MAGPVSFRLKSKRSRFVALSKGAKPRILAEGMTAASTARKADKIVGPSEKPFIVPIRKPDCIYVL